jgi:protein-L-isoaspartate(D-aspartate) O-methyltransferase
MTDEFTTQRQYMVDHDLRGRGIVDERVLDAMLRVPRHQFVPEQYRNQAHEDHPLPIGEDQTISQPYIVALMLQELQLSPSDKILEVGTGSGYVSALLAELTAEVFSIERHASLAGEARRTLADLGYTNIRIIAGDGTQGFLPGAPYSAIIVSAAALAVPNSLLSQLAEGGRMIIPVGASEGQQLQLIRMISGQPQLTKHALCRFVPLVSDGTASSS